MELQLPTKVHLKFSGKNPNFADIKSKALPIKACLRNSNNLTMANGTFTGQTKQKFIKGACCC